MKKKNIIYIVLALIVALVIAFIIFNNKKGKINEDDNTKLNGTSKILVVYYSAQSHTENVALKIAENLDADVFEVRPTNIYTSSDLDWTNSNSRVSKEHDDTSLRDVELVNYKVNNWDNYDTIIIGYPIWWGIAAWPMNTFVKNNDFTNKTVIPFCTSSSSSIGESDKLLKEMTTGGTWLEGKRFSSNPSSSDIKNFTDKVKNNN